jgi:uncharacterized protein YdeI (YjbR/CyaY-like superfamily)
MSRAPATKPELPILECATDAEWRGWLAEHHALSPGVWLKFAKRDAAAGTVNHAQALDEAPAAREFFETLTGQRRYAFLYRLHHVKRPDARERRIASYVELLREGKTLN